jgi:hypothetical protein
MRSREHAAVRMMKSFLFVLWMRLPIFKPNAMDKSIVRNILSLLFFIRFYIFIRFHIICTSPYKFIAYTLMTLATLFAFCIPAITAHTNRTY